MSHGVVIREAPRLKPHTHWATLADSMGVYSADLLPNRNGNSYHSKVLYEFLIMLY